MNKRYRLKKDMPHVRAGAIFEKNGMELKRIDGDTERKLSEDPFYVIGYSEVVFAGEFDEWFEELSLVEVIVASLQMAAREMAEHLNPVLESLKESASSLISIFTDKDDDKGKE